MIVVSSQASPIHMREREVALCTGVKLLRLEGILASMHATFAILKVKFALAVLLAITARQNSPKGKRVGKSSRFLAAALNRIIDVWKQCRLDLLYRRLARTTMANASLQRKM